MAPAVRIISSLMRYGKLLKRWANQSGTRVSGRTGKSGAKVRGVLKTQPGKRKSLSGRRSKIATNMRRVNRDNANIKGVRLNKVISGRRAPNVPVVESASGGRTIVNQADALRLRKSAAVASKVRKGLIIGGVGGSAIVGSTVANRKQTKSEPTYTEKNPGGMRFKKAPESKYLSYSRLEQEITRMEKRDPKREKGYSPKMSEPVATEKRPMGMKFSAAPPLASSKKKGKSFKQTFDAARYGESGYEGKKFSWDGKDYVAVTKDDLKKRGLKNLGEWQKREKSIKALKKKGLMMRKVSRYY